MNPKVGDIEGNKKKILLFVERAYSEGAKIICFPEMALCGYPPDDLVFQDTFISEQEKAIEEIIKEIPEDVIVIVGYVSKDSDLYNSAAVICNRKIFRYDKIHLPNYGVFDEFRYFERGRKIPVFVTEDGFRFGVTICEDIWHPTEPLLTLISRGKIHLVINISSSPYHISKPKIREDMLRIRASDYSVWVAFCNAVGGQDELVFDGTSSVISPYGDTVARLPSFDERMLVKEILIDEPFLKRVHDPRVRFETSSSRCEEIKLGISVVSPEKPRFQEMSVCPFLEEEEEIFSALVTGTRDYVLKNGFSKVIVGLSGGIDSSLVACIAAEAVGPENVLGVSMPSQFSSHHSQEDAEILSRNLGIKFIKIPINNIYDAFLRELEFLFAETKFSSAEENLQARIRGNILMTISNKLSYLVLACGNKSEMSLGYATLYGDLSGGFAPIKDVYKTDVYRLAKYYNRKKGREIIPQRVFEKPPSAELRPGQKDEDDLPLPYHKLDRVLALYIEKDLPPFVISRMLDIDMLKVQRVIKMLEQAEYKRRQAPPGVKITSRAFGKDRRMPITKDLRYLEKF